MDDQLSPPRMCGLPVTYSWSYQRAKRCPSTGAYRAMVTTASRTERTAFSFAPARTGPARPRPTGGSAFAGGFLPRRMRVLEGLFLGKLLERLIRDQKFLSRIRIHAGLNPVVPESK